MSDDCLFCKIIKKEIPADIVLQNEMVTAFRDINPVAPEHILIIPNKHVKDINEMAIDEEGASILPGIARGIREITEELGLVKDGFRVVTNLGANAGQAVFHLHFHIIGGRNLKWPPG